MAPKEPPAPTNKKSIQIISQYRFKNYVSFPYFKLFFIFIPSQKKKIDKYLHVLLTRITKIVQNNLIFRDDPMM